jgi:hypothetical protein
VTHVRLLQFSGDLNIELRRNLADGQAMYKPMFLDCAAAEL